MILSRMVEYHDLENLAEKFRNCSMEGHHNQQSKKCLQKYSNPSKYHLKNICSNSTVIYKYKPVKMEIKSNYLSW